MDNNSLIGEVLGLSVADAEALFGKMSGDILHEAWRNLKEDYAADIGIDLNGGNLWEYCIDEAIAVTGLDRDKTDVCFNYLCSEVYYSGEYTEEQKDKFEELTGCNLQVDDE